MGNKSSKSGDLLLYALEDLSHHDFKRFKDKLSHIDFKGQRNIPRGRLERADHIDTKNLLMKRYGAETALDVAIEVFTKISLMGPASGLREARERALDPGESHTIPDTDADYRRKYMKHIVDRYTLIEDRNARPGETVCLQKRYTKLLIVEKHRLQHEREHEIMSSGKKHIEIMDSLVQSMSYTDMEALFQSPKDGSRPRTIVLQGPAGIGKTMTARKIMLDWASGKLYQGVFDFVFYISCREINQIRSEKSVSDLIAAGCPDRTLPKNLLLRRPDQLLFIVDGFDELAFTLDLQEDQICTDPFQRNPVAITLSNLITKNILSTCSIIITTRPVALSQLRKYLMAPQFAEIMGFTEEDRRIYFNNFFDNDSQASLALTVVKDNDILYTMCFVPIICWIVCTVMKQQIERGQDINYASKTTTSVYLFFLSSLLRDHSRASVNDKQRSLKRLCLLALQGILQWTILFTEEDLKAFDLNVSDIQSIFLNKNIFQADIDCISAYSFIHLSFQEFFAALYFMLDVDIDTDNLPAFSKSDVNNLLDMYSEGYNDHLMLTVRFLFGLINRDRMAHMENILICKISQRARDDLLAWINEPKGASLVLNTLHYLYEIHDADVVSRIINNIQDISFADFYPRRINDMDYKVLLFCLHHCQGQKNLQLSGLELGPKAQEVLRPVLWKCSALRLRHCNLMKKEPSLFKEDFEEDVYGTVDLDFNQRESGNPSDMSLLCEGLRDPRCKLQTLTVKFCNLSDTCCQDLSGVIAVKPFLRELNLSENPLGIAGLKLLLEGLTHRNRQLQVLKLKRCHLSAECCNELHLLLQHQSLEELVLSENPLEDSGLRWICEGLKHPDCRLQTLVLRLCIGHLERLQGTQESMLTDTQARWPQTSAMFPLQKCSLTAQGCASLFTVLTSVVTLRELNVSVNKLEDSGVPAICDYLKHPECTLQTLRVVCCELTDRCCLDLAGALKVNRSLIALDLGANSLEDAGVTTLCQELKDEGCHLQSLSLSCCDVKGASCEDLARFLRTNHSLLELDLNNNELDDDGVRLLCDVLKRPDCKLQKIKFEAYHFSESVFDELKMTRPELEIVMDYP